MQENNDKKVPQLRFLGFDGDWEVKKLGEISDNIMYGMNSSAIVYDGEHKYIRITDIDANNRNFKPKPLTSPDGKKLPKFKLKEGDIVFSRTGASVGKAYHYNIKDGNLYFAGFLIKIAITKACPSFVYHQTFRKSYWDWVKVMSVRSGQPGLNAEQYKRFHINLPSLPEQQKIANFLSSIDKKISLLEQKTEQLEAFKKGMMQQLLTGKKRFQEFVQEEGFKETKLGMIPKDWEIVKIEDVTKISGKYGINAASVDYSEKLPSYLRITDIDKFGNIKKEGLKSVSHIDAHKYILCDEDIVFARTGATVGKTYFHNIEKNGELVYAGFLIMFRADKAKLIPYFLKVQTLINTYWDWIKVTSVRSGQPGVNGKQYCSYSFALPSLPEQKKIAACLSSIDQQIQDSRVQLEAVKMYKKGLLQQLLV